MSHFTGKVYDLTQENFQKVIAELEEAKESLRITVEALEHIANNGPMAIDLLKQKGEKTPAFEKRVVARPISMGDFYEQGKDCEMYSEKEMREVEL